MSKIEQSFETMNVKVRPLTTIRPGIEAFPLHY